VTVAFQLVEAFNRLEKERYPPRANATKIITMFSIDDLSARADDFCRKAGQKMIQV